MKKNRFIYFVATCLLATGFASCDNCCAKDAKIQNEIDSLNYAFGVANGAGIRDYYLQNDTTDKNVKALIKGLNEALKSKDESLRFYALGLNIGASLSTQTKSGLMGDSTLVANLELIKQGLIASIKKENTKMTADEADAFLRSTMEKIQAQKNEAEFGENKRMGEEFLAENAKKQGVVVTESGLQYEVIKEGKGAKPVATDKVKVHYKGTLIDGTVFDSSTERNQPAEFIVSGVIRGWTEALQMMPVGSKWKLYIPQELAYGSQNTGRIQPFSTLIFEVELLSIEK